MSKATKKAPRKAGRSVFVYTSACCSLKAVKEPLVATEEAEGTLGKFRCSGCKKRCKCTRSLNKKEEAVVETKTEGSVGGSDAPLGA